ncbi:hypothetical protein Y032_0342g3034 [Ancylostoma ceylanicum]|uniref:Uncharacterized protein n=1 Tax=Ancylostoma ceylanicum TaxID=53326 RepID=A0A016RXX0_9BILA|nr:hypothetical protein Y032_0342g3034 [Ancylostoma ceylanicum]
MKFTTPPDKGLARCLVNFLIYYRTHLQESLENYFEIPVREVRACHRIRLPKVNCEFRCSHTLYPSRRLFSLHCLLRDLPRLLSLSHSKRHREEPSAIFGLGELRE